MSRCSTKVFGYGALAMATAFIVSMSAPASAQVADEVWASDCELDSDTVQGLRDAMIAAGLATAVDPAYVVIHTFRNNDGQPTTTQTDPEGPHTGMVYCINPLVTNPPDDTVQQTDDIGGPVDILDLHSSVSVRYELSSGVEKRHCDTVEGVQFCNKFTPKP